MTTQWQNALIASGFAVSSPAFQIQGTPKLAVVVIAPMSSANLNSTMTFTLEQAHIQGKDIASASFAPVYLPNAPSSAWSALFTKGAVPITDLGGMDQLRVVQSSVGVAPRSVALILKY